MKGIYYVSTDYDYKYPFKLAGSLTELFGNHSLNDNLLTDEEIISYEEEMFQSYSINGGTQKGILPISQDIRTFFISKFPNAVLINKESNSQKIIREFLSKHNLTTTDFTFPEGRYSSLDYEAIDSAVHKLYPSSNFYFIQFIPSDFYAIGIFDRVQVKDLIKMGLLTEKNYLPDGILSEMR